MKDNGKYPVNLFIIGFITNVLFRFFWLFASGIILSIIGIFVKWCLYIGVALLLLDVVLSLIEQIKIRKTFLKESENLEFKAFQDAVLKDEDWRVNVRELLNQKISDAQSEEIEKED